MSEFSPTKVLNAARSSKHDFALGGRKSKTIQDESEDPSHLLNVWLGELDSLQKGLETTLSPFGRDLSYVRPHSASTSSRESSSTPVHLRRLSTPRVESPRLDSYRYSLINLEETLENDLDAILGELCALDLESGCGKSSSKVSSTSSPVALRKHHQKPKLVIEDDVESMSGEMMPPPPPPPPLSTRPGTIEKYLQSVTEPQYISAELVRQNKLSSNQPLRRIGSQGEILTKRTDSPDNDSAFSDNVSSNSSNESSPKKIRSVSISSQSDIIGQSNGTLHPNSELDSAAKLKAEKIRLAIEKIKEASIKKIFIKVFSEDGSAKSLLVDERMTVAQVCRLLADKNHQKRDAAWGLVELLPDLHMERAYEDHEFLVENLLMWKADSKNTLWFIKRPEVFDLFHRPEMYLLGDASSQSGTEMDDRSRSELVEEYFSSTGVGAPEVEGILWLKAEAKKTWKRFYFVLRSSGLYYSPKGKKSSRDLVCLATCDMNQVYFGVKWQPKFKSPSKHCFAIKHPQIQAKNPKYIRYLCADTEEDLNKWVTGIRIAKYGRLLYDNYRTIVEDIVHDDLDRLASARLSFGSTSQNGVQKNYVTLADQTRGPSHILDANRIHLDVSDNKSFDSAMQVSDGCENNFRSNSQASNGSSLMSSQLGSKSNQTPTSTLSSRSASSGSLSEKSSSALSSIELGFNCDSPEGGTIKKKPSLANTIKSSLKQENSKKSVQKEVTLVVSPKKQDSEDYLPSPPPELNENLEESSGPLYQTLVEAFTLGRSPKKFSHSGQDASFPPSNPPTRHFSQESLSSNSAMLHSAMLIKSSDELPPSHDSQTPPELLNPQPSRPAPVLKPAVSKKPSIEKSFLMKKQMIEEKSQSKPTYEETLRKCQSLTRHQSSPLPHQDNSAKVVRQNSCPVVPPKPQIVKKIVHLPPTGQSVKLRTSLQNHHLNQTFLQDLHRAMANKLDSEKDFRFPNRLSSGEYENVAPVDTSNRNLKVYPRPPLPKRSDETHLTWKRS